MATAAVLATIRVPPMAGGPSRIASVAISAHFAQTAFARPMRGDTWVLGLNGVRYRRRYGASAEGLRTDVAPGRIWAPLGGGRQWTWPTAGA